MIMHALSGQVPPELARRLAAFELEFSYPLGPESSFRIAHGDDYPRFFRAIGDAMCFVAEQAGRVVGTLGVARRRLLTPDGGEREAVYLCDLKISAPARGGRTLLSLARSAQAWVARHDDAAFSIVMDGTALTPAQYTGRLGLPAFEELGKIWVLRVPTSEAMRGREHGHAADFKGTECYRRLSSGRYATPGGNPAERSEAPAQWLVHPTGAACGRLEDTRLAKRLISMQDGEMLSAHLSCFAFDSMGAGADLLRVALDHAARRGYPALFVAVAEPEARHLIAALAPTMPVIAPATIFGAGLARGSLWNVNTAEI